jgi:hypothetical protein
MWSVMRSPLYSFYKKKKWVLQSSMLEVEDNVWS